MTKSNYRLRISSPPASGRAGLTYVTRYGDRVSYISADETPLALSNLILHGAAEVRFVLEDASDGYIAAAGLRAALKYQWERNPSMCPIVEVI
jgi:hypothetical protein